MKTKSLLITGLAFTLTFTSSAQWVAQAPMNIARGQHGAIAHPNGNVYVWGGFNSGSPFSSLEIYNQASNIWTTGAPIPIQTRGMAFALGLDSLLYCFGGFDATHLFTCFKYNVNTNSWTPIAPLPVASWECTAATAPNGNIYVFGGENSMNLVQVYNPVSNTWSAGAPLPVASRMHSAVTAPNGKIYVIGGYNGSTAITNNQIYDPVLNSWSIGAPLPLARNQFGATLGPGGKIYIIGGKNSGGNNTGPFYSNVDVYDPNTDTWTTEVSLPVAIGETEAVAVNGGINLFGGTSGTYLASNYRLDLICGTLGVTTSSSSIICIGQSVTLNAAGTGGTPGYTYQWSTGEITSSIIVSPTSTSSYTVTVTDSINCVAISPPIVVTVRPPLLVSALGNSTICCNNPATISSVATGGDANYSYSWLPNIGSGPGPLTVTPCTTTTYTVTVNDGCGTPPASASVVVTVNPLPILTLTPQEDTVCVNSTINILFGTPPGGTYFGFAVTGNNFNAAFAGAGTHSVSYRYTDSNGCTDSITVSVFVDLCTGVESLIREASILDIFPNPVTNELTIVNSWAGIEIVNVYDVLGEKVLQRTIHGENKAVINVKTFPAGVYFIVVKDDKNNFVTRKIMKF